MLVCTNGCMSGRLQYLYSADSDSYRLSKAACSKSWKNFFSIRWLRDHHSKNVALSLPTTMSQYIRATIR